MKKVLGFILALCLILSFSTVSLATTVSTPDIPGGAYVLDEAEVFDLDSENKLTAKSESLKTDTGLELYIVTTANKSGASLKDYTYAIFDSWNIGGAEDKGIILVLDIEGDNYYLKPGDSIRDVFTGTVLQGYLDTYLEGDYADGNYSDGAVKLHDALSALARRNYEAAESLPPIESQPEESASQPEESADENENAEENNGGGFWGFIGGFFKVIFIIFLILVALVVIINVRGQMVKKKRREARAEARRKRIDARKSSYPEKKAPAIVFDEDTFDDIESSEKEETEEPETQEDISDFEEEVIFEEEDHGLNVTEDDDDELIISAFDDIIAKRKAEKEADDFDDIDLNDFNFDEEIEEVEDLPEDEEE